MRRLLLLGFLSAIPVFAQASPTGSASAPASQSSTPSAPLPRFEDIAPQAGLTTSHISSTEKRYIIESVSGGIGLIDCDNDGRLDIIAVNGSNVDRYRKQG